MHVFYVILSNKFLLICYANSKPFWPLGKNKKLTTLWNLNYIRGILIRSNIDRIYEVFVAFQRYFGKIAQ